MNKKISLAAVLFLFSYLFSMAQDNPFFSGSEPPTETQAPPSQGLFQGIFSALNDFQRELNAKLAELSRLVNEEHATAVFFALLAVAFVYGLVHALGPGHGKIIMVSYALANPLKAKQGVLLGAGVAIIHTFSAVVLVSILYLVLQGSYTQYAGEPKKIISLISYGLVTGMGFFFLLRAFLRARRPYVPNEGLSIAPGAGKTRELVVPALLMGLVPCEGAVLVLVFSLSIGAFWLGIVLAAAMSAGMAITISAMGLIALGAKKGSVRLLSKRKKLVRTGLLILQFFGAAVIFLFGALLFIAHLK